MSIDVQDWLDMASVYSAGALKQRGFSNNTGRQQQADALDIMAGKYIDTTVERGAKRTRMSALRHRRQVIAERAARNSPLRSRDG
jgi:hypothetical protein